MKNKLGLSDTSNVEKKIIFFKKMLIKDYFSFDIDKYDLDLLKSLNDFLYSDIYYDTGKISKDYDSQYEVIFNKKIKDIIFMIDFMAPIDEIISLINKFIDFEIFTNGNYLTIKLFYLTIKLFYLNIVENYINKNKYYEKLFYEIENITE